MTNSQFVQTLFSGCSGACLILFSKFRSFQKCLYTVP